MTTPTGRCPECGAHLEGSSRLGNLCPRCLLQMGMENSGCSELEDSTVPHYRILRRLGRGGMGEVYLARDTHLERRVALKFIAEELQHDEKARRRLLREAKAAAALDHPFICHIHEVTRIRGKDCIVMEYVEGQTLRERLQEGRIPTQETVRIALQSAQALEKAHEGGFVHRDLKPSNILLTVDGNIKVMDFGLAKKTAPVDSPGQDTATLSNLTRPGTAVGTPAYMSPEQICGQEIDSRSDIFSFGVLLYEMLSGVHPFRKNTDLETAAAILETAPPPLPPGNTKTRKTLQRMLRRMLAKEPQNRIQSVQDVTKVLQELQAITAESPHKRRRSRSPLTPGYRRLLIAGTVFVLFILAFVTLQWQRSPPGNSGGEAINSIGILPFENRSSNPELDFLSVGLVHSVAGRLSRLKQLHKVVSKDSLQRQKNTAFNARAAASELGVQAIVRGVLGTTGTHVVLYVDLLDGKDGRTLWSDRFERKQSDVLEIEEVFAGEIASALGLQLTDLERRQLSRRNTADPEAYRLYQRGRFFWSRRTLDDFKRAIDDFDRAIKIDPGFALAYSGTADCYALIATGLYGSDPLLSRQQALSKARTDALQALSLDGDLAEAQSTLANILLDAWDWQDGGKALRRAISLDPNYATARRWYAEYLSTIGQPERALEQARQAVALAPFSPMTNYTLGIVLLHSRDYARAIDQLKHTLEMDPPPLKEARQHLVLAYWLSENRQEAIQVSREWFPETAKFLALLEQGNETQAVSFLERNRPQILPSLLYILAGNKDKALTGLEKLIEQHHIYLSDLMAEPILDPLRSDPRFAELRRKMNLK